MTSDYIIALIELSPNVGNDEYIVQCNFGGHSTSGVEVIEGGPLDSWNRGQVWKVASKRKSWTLLNFHVYVSPFKNRLSYITSKRVKTITFK